MATVLQAIGDISGNLLAFILFGISCDPAKCSDDSGAIEVRSAYLLRSCHNPDTFRRLTLPIKFCPSALCPSDQHG